MSRVAAFILRVDGSTADFMRAGEFMTILFLVVMLTVVNLVI